MDATEPDVLSDVLGPLRLTGLYVSRWLAGGRWAVAGHEDSNAVLHHMVRGSCVVTFPDGPSEVLVEEGDLALFPYGTAHTFASREGGVAAPLASLLPPEGPGPGTVVLGDGGEGGAETEMLCATLRYDAAAEPALYRALPRVLVLRRAVLAGEPLLRGTLEALATELPRAATGRAATGRTDTGRTDTGRTDTGRTAHGQRAAPGARLVSLRAFEMVFVLALRAAMERSAEESPALQALRHPGIGRALAAVYGAYDRPWTVGTLAREAGMSRSAFSRLFHDLVGEPPARHLQRRRLQEARALLGDGAVPPAAVAARVGYQSQVGFHLAFRKECGVTPGEYRARAAAAPLTAPPAGTPSRGPRSPRA
ncbi:AraC family transcriptional regulator [Streptomyces albiaxialis]|uniref:AraC family transcriptional regulator n=1 Tax=Streptomyces albiaxialis TaxID=329523 RepID=A0ABN2WFD1_9ACTN